ncbi:bifunctional nuclease 1 [Aristolochia californica]|uniref:bifunctional nuclease 1 n=1 Tax=Aristolochia californica TaxID=171875 RepID=UPI0035D5CE88
MLRVRPVSGLALFSDPSSVNFPFSNSGNLHRLQYSVSFRLIYRGKRLGNSKSICISCRASRGSWGDRNENWDERESDFLGAVVLTSETARHYHMLKHGFLEEMKWQQSSHLTPFSIQAWASSANVGSIGSGLLRRFRSPTIFLKVSCDGDMLLPIIVGDSAVEKLIEVLPEEESEECPGQFQFLKNLVGSLGYEVKKVQITHRVINTYFARIFLGKAGEKTMVSLDARPSDAINVAKRCKAPIYVSKEIVLADAIRLVYGKWRGHGVKSIYDVTLDSAPEGPDSLVEELNLLKKMNLAVLEERYIDAAICRDELNKLRMSRQKI